MLRPNGFDLAGLMAHMSSRVPKSGGIRSNKASIGILRPNTCVLGHLDPLEVLGFGYLELQGVDLTLRVQVLNHKVSTQNPNYDS